MYAIVEIGGKQFKVRENDTIHVPRLQADVEDTVTFDRVLLVVNNGSTQVGTPVVDGASISATVEEHVRAGKVIVFKKKRRKRYKVTRGHRQQYSRVKIGPLTV